MSKLHSACKIPRETCSACKIPRETCSMKVSISPRHLDEFRKSLETEKQEIGSVLHFKLPKAYFFSHSEKPLQHHFESKSSLTIKGDADSVDPPLGAVNLHTHPHSCYKSEKCALGWPSGEDMREVLRYHAKGNIAHFVITMEGVYSIQSNPCLTHFLQSIPAHVGPFSGDALRGGIMVLIDMYFQTFHRFRTFEAIEWFKKHKHQTITPAFFVKIANAFALPNVYQKRIPMFEDKYETMDPIAYLKDAGKDKFFQVYGIRPNGNPYELPKKQQNVDYLIEMMPTLFQLIKEADLGKHCCRLRKTNNNKNKPWRTGWFHVEFFPYDKPTMPYFHIYFDDAKGRCYPSQVLSMK